MSMRHLIASTLVAGVAIGSVVAVGHRGAPAPALAAPVGAASIELTQRAPITPSGPVAIAARAADRGGGTPWAVRRLTTRQGGKTVPCIQLGRLDGKRFGWIPPGQPFRLARFD